MKVAQELASLRADFDAFKAQVSKERCPHMVAKSERDHAETMQANMRAQQEVARLAAEAALPVRQFVRVKSTKNGGQNPPMLTFGVQTYGDLEPHFGGKPLATGARRIDFDPSARAGYRFMIPVGGTVAHLADDFAALASEEFELAQMIADGDLVVTPMTHAENKHEEATRRYNMIPRAAF